MIKLLFSIYFLSYSGVVENTIEKNVRPVTEGYSYKDDLDDAKFRVSVYEASAERVTKALKNNPSNLCSYVKNKDGLDLSTSSNYLVSVLKKAGAIESDDKNYGLVSAHFIWEYYLTYRNFVDVSYSFKDFKSDKLFKTLPEGYIVQVKNGCVKNGAVALKCGKGFYTTKFPNITKLKNSLDDKNNQKCKISNGLRVIVEASRLYSEFASPQRELSSE